MKKIVFVIGIGLCMLACNNASTSGSTTDSLQNKHINQSEVNDKNTPVYDSSSTGKDTASYERMNNIKK